jgi:hypothetical protein
MSNRNADWIARAAIAAMFMLAAAVWSWPSVPAQLPLRWSMVGQPDAYGSKFLGLWMLPTVALAGYALIGLTAVIRPGQFDGRVKSALSWFRLAYVILMAGVFGVVVAGAGGSNVNMNYVVLPLLALMLIAAANMMVQLSRNKSAKAAAPPGGPIEV